MLPLCECPRIVARPQVPIPAGAFVRLVASCAGNILGSVADLLRGTLFSHRGRSHCDASFAGQHDTYLDVKTLAGVVDAVKRWRASMWTACATKYRNTQHNEHRTVGVAVVIAQMVDAEVASVLLTAYPITTTDEALLDASWGRDEAIVAALVTADSYTVKLLTLRVKHKTLGANARKIVRDPHAVIGTVEMDVAPGQRSRFSLSHGQAVAVAAIGRRVIEFYGGFPQDLEFAIADDRIHLLQSRPITSVEFSWDEDLDHWHVLPEDEDVLFSRSVSDQVCHGAITPLFYSSRGRMLEANPMPGLCAALSRRGQASTMCSSMPRYSVEKLTSSPRRMFWARAGDDVFRSGAKAGWQWVIQHPSGAVVQHMGGPLTDHAQMVHQGLAAWIPPQQSCCRRLHHHREVRLGS